MPAEKNITKLTQGTVLGTDVGVAVDVTDQTMAVSGTTKKYTRSDIVTYLLTVFGYTTLAPAKVATTAALTATYDNGTLGDGATLVNAGTQIALSIDGQALAIDDLVVVKNQVNAFENGLYVVTDTGSDTTNWELMRAINFDVSADIVDNLPIYINYGTVNGNTIWRTNVTAPVVVGTDPINFVSFEIVPASLINFPVEVSEGGTGLQTLTPYAVIAGGTTTTGAMQQVAGVGTSGQVLSSQGAGALPQWVTIPGAASAALTKNDDTNVTLTLGGSPSNALLNATSITAGWTGQLSVARGGTGASTASGALSNLGALPLAGGTMTGTINMDSNTITNLPLPVLDSEPVTYGLFNSVVYNTHPACVASTTGNLAGYTYDNGTAGVGATLTAGSNGAFSADGVSPALNDRVLVQLQTAQAENGIYVLSQVGDGSNPAILTRATDYDTADDMQAGDTVRVIQGSTYALDVFVMTQTAAITVGTTAITWQQDPAGSGALLAANNLSDVADQTTSFDNVSPTTTKGDLIANDGTNNIRLGVGTDGQKLVADSGETSGLRWADDTATVGFESSLLLGGM